MFDITPHDPACTMCAGEGYVKKKLDEIWLQGIKVKPYTQDVWVFCVHCMGTGNNDRKIIETLKYIEMDQRLMNGFHTSNQHLSVREALEKANGGTLYDWIHTVNRMDCYEWFLDFPKMKKYDAFILGAREKNGDVKL